MRSFIQGYKDDRFWSKITTLLQKEKVSVLPPDLPFCFDNNLIFRRDGYISSDHAFEPRLLCIPQSLVKEILKANHDENGHLGFLRCYERVASSYYIRNLSAHLKAYLKHCAACNVNQTRRHPTYGSLQPTLSPPTPFHSVTMDFILALPLSHNGKDNLMTVTCKFAKRVLLIPGHSKWGVAEWASALLEQL